MTNADELARINAAPLSPIRSAALQDHDAHLQHQLSVLKARVAAAESDTKETKAALTKAVLNAAQVEFAGNQALARSRSEMQAEIDRLRATLSAAKTIDYSDDMPPEPPAPAVPQESSHAEHRRQIEELEDRHANDLQRLGSGLGDRLAQEVDAKLRDAQAEWEQSHQAALTERDRHWKIEIDKRLEKARQAWGASQAKYLKHGASIPAESRARRFVHVALEPFKITEHGVMRLVLVVAVAVAAATVTHYATIHSLPGEQPLSGQTVQNVDAPGGDNLVSGPAIQDAETPGEEQSVSISAVKDAEAKMADAPAPLSPAPPQDPPVAATIESTEVFENIAIIQNDTKSGPEITEAELVEAQRLAEKAKLEADEAKRDAQAALLEAQATLQQTEVSAAEERAALETQIDTLRTQLEAAELRAEEANQATGSAKSKLNRAVARAKQAERASQAERARSETEVRFRVRELLDKLRQQIAAPQPSFPTVEDDAAME